MIEAVDLRRSYKLGGETIQALDGVNLSVRKGEFVAIMGPSGSGKSTFMNVLGCLDSPTSGHYHLAGTDMSALNNDARAIVRSRMIGFVFQNFNLLPRLTALDNVELPLLYAASSGRERRRRTMKLLSELGLAERAWHRPAQLSGGQQQRVAIARALVNDPILLLADEPTGALDSQTGNGIMSVLRRLNRESELTIVLVTHEVEVAAYADRVITFRDGRIIADRQPHPHATPESDAYAGA